MIGVAPTTKGGSDGKITGVDATMEYRAESETIYTACTGIEIENLPAGNYFVRYAEDNNHFAGPDVAVTVGEGAPLADCTITFNGNGGSGSMEPVTVKAETNYILPRAASLLPPIRSSSLGDRRHGVQGGRFLHRERGYRDQSTMEEQRYYPLHLHRHRQ